MCPPMPPLRLASRRRRRLLVCSKRVDWWVGEEVRKPVERCGALGAAVKAPLQQSSDRLQRLKASGGLYTGEVAMVS